VHPVEPTEMRMSYGEDVTTSRTLWILHLDGPDDPRFGAALEFLREGHAIGYRGISLSMDASGLRCCMQASWRSEALTEHRALADFAGMQQTLEELRETRTDFATVTRARPVRFSLVDDYGTGVVELCHLADGTVVGLSQP
jgi:hypothetical protein